MKSVLKWYGGKSRLARKLVSLTPKTCTCRVEPFGGALWYTLATDPEDTSEVVSDLSGQLTNFWWCLQQEDLFDKLSRRLEATPFSQFEFEKLDLPLGPVPDPEAAARFFIHCRQSRAGEFKSFTPITRNRLRRGMNEQCAAWWTAIEGLEPVMHRLRRVLILNKPAIAVIRLLESPTTHFYLDPPYPSSVRTTGGNYSHEMSSADHIELLDVVKMTRGTFMISGKRNDLYDDKLSDWHRVDIDVPLDVAGGKQKRRDIECVWMNYDL